MENLFLFIQQFIRLEEEDKQTLTSLIHTKHYAKGSYFCKQGNYCKNIGFMESGIARTYFLHDGKEITSYFSFAERNKLICSFSSFLTQKPSQESIHFLEDARIYLISFEQLQQLYQSDTKWLQLGKSLAEYNYLLAMERIHSLQINKAKERLLALEHIYPKLMTKIPQHYIASYLGITPEALSRLRKELL